MNELPPILRDQRKVDANHLNLLAIFHFISAGFALLGMLFLLAHFAIFHAVFSHPEIFNDPKLSPDGRHGPNPAEIFAVFKWFYLVIGTWILCSGILNLISGFYLRARKHWTFSVVVAVFNCFYMPIGTVLGVFTIIVLVRDSVRELYDA
ncbi:MAG TPA: hypothetical protein VHV55_10800 [Pirellulales bacterium]|jgi:uncharacterized membrane protein HdeD (DUF308 family)|nr:hypothetical protein [Pirellulales bacterium]